MKTSRQSQFPLEILEILSSKTLNQSPDSSLQEIKNVGKSHRRKIRNPSFSSVGIRLKKERTSAVKRNEPSTPLLRWKLDDGDVSISDTKTPEDSRKCRRKVKNGREVSVSARKLAAGLWLLQQPEVHDGGGESRDLQKMASDRLGFESGVGHIGTPIQCSRNNRKFGTDAKDMLQGSLSFSTPKNGILSKIQPSLSFPNSAMEGATKWDPGCSKTSDEVYRFYNHVKLLEDQQIATVSVVSSLQSELEQARICIHELEIERQSSKKKVEHFMRKVSEEKASWQSREHEKIRAIINDVKSDLKRERKNCHRLEIFNSKLVNELAEAKLSAKRSMQDYEKERKARELMEEVCNELATEIGEDKAEVEAMKRESMIIREEVEEERKMMQMAEVWREERVQMKLIDAKLTLEKKYSELNKLIENVEAFLRSRGVTEDMMEMRETELLREAASSVKIHDVKDFSYEPPNLEDIFPVFEDIQPGGPKEREIEPCLDYSPPGHSSKIHNVSPEVNGFSKNPMKRDSNGFICQNRVIEEDESGWETASRTEEQGSSYSSEGSDPSVNRTSIDSNVSGSGTEWEENAGHDTPNTEVSEIISVSTRKSKKASSIYRLWRSNPSKGDNCKIISVKGTNDNLSNGRISNGGIVSPDRGSGESGPSPSGLVARWSSSDSGNPHITPGMKGRIEWQLGMEQNSLKEKLLEARMASQKGQLRHVLKQKI